MKAKKEIILGISPLDCDTNVSLFQEGQLIFAAAEERFTRIKQQMGFPHKALQAALKYTSIPLKEVSVVVYPFLSSYLESGCMIKNFFKLARRIPCEPLSPKDRLLNVLGATWSLARGIRYHLKYYRELVLELKRLRLDKKFRCYPHHLSHAWSAYYFSGFDECLAVVADGYGTGLATSIWLCKKGKPLLLTEVKATDSLGDFYGSVTHAMGFKANRHEGKVLGLAAFGNPKILKEEFEKRFRLLGMDGYQLFGGRQIRFWIQRLMKNHSREDIAAAAQNLLEEALTNYIGYYLKKTGISKIALAGGVVANVKLNQRIYEMDGVSEVFVFPGMGDVGAGIGASLLYNSEQNFPLLPSHLPHVYLGPHYTEEEIKTALNQSGLLYHRIPNLEEKVAALLAEGMVVGWFQGKMEFGPRALGNRSILVQATRPEINKTLNEKLGRSEFMPFAPVTLFEKRQDCYVNSHQAMSASEFMTVTFNCTPQMKNLSPAAVHIDGTARPQIIKKETNLPYHAVVESYYKKTGIPSLINTSFNIHEEPIVLSPQDAIETFKKARLDYLAIGPFLVSHKENFQ